MRSREEQAAVEFMDNLDYLRQRLCQSYVRPGITRDQIFDVVDKELQILANSLLKYTRPDYEFQVINVNFRKLRFGVVTLGTHLGFCMNLRKNHIAVFDQWVHREPERKAIKFREWMNTFGRNQQHADGTEEWLHAMNVRYGVEASVRPYWQIVEEANKALGLV